MSKQLLRVSCILWCYYHYSTVSIIQSFLKTPVCYASLTYLGVSVSKKGGSISFLLLLYVNFCFDAISNVLLMTKQLGKILFRQVNLRFPIYVSLRSIIIASRRKKIYIWQNSICPGPVIKNNFNNYFKLFIKSFLQVQLHIH